ncbi:hypothetical protein K504DRAFT_391589 [Pleomassaria siparia CBS 279.74]|uniref:Tyrosine specific protein phosphatases domain-containing protein n=1 Tax=Pleomassaria siparia CBS 279.74 TaxID=1314801 RepID=A0A6G1JU04_9PLEO|nr:hypothetical protein K504DRAFT_391589 [Pleomassaria siparia CBS 279.74]
MSSQLPQPPFFVVANINNLRDAALFPGGLKTTEKGKKIREGVLFRSAEVSKLDAAGWKAVKDIGVGRVFDLRSKPEVDKGWAGITGGDKGDGGDVRPGWIEVMEGAGVERDWVPVFEASDYSPERLAERYAKYMGEDVSGFVQAYQDILQNAGPSFRTILLYLASLPPPPSPPNPGSTASSPSAPADGALIHCTAGKDRTGIFFGLLFSFLGVDARLIAQEYHLTDLGLASIRDDVVGRLMLSSGFRKYMDSQMDGGEAVVGEQGGGEQGRGGEENIVPPEVLDKGRQAALRMVGASKETMLASLEMLESVFGGAERYMRDFCGLGDEDLDGLRRALVVRE